MSLHEVKTHSLADGIFGEIAGRILDGSYAPGTNLPPERQLAEDFGVNRHVVREATKRAQQVGLVSATQGGGTRVLDFERTAGLDALVLLAENASEDLRGALIWRAGLEMRAAIGTDLARLCAVRGDAEVKGDLVSLAHQMKGAVTGDALAAIDQRFWGRMLDGANNIAYRLAYNSLIRSAEAAPTGQLDLVRHELEASDFRLPIAEAIAAGDSAAAEAAARVSLRGAIVAIESVIERLTEAERVA